MNYFIIMSNIRVVPKEDQIYGIQKVFHLTTLKPRTYVGKIIILYTVSDESTYSF